ncbi:glycerol uptake operon antiterminator [Paenibacillus cellulosilyticus]|uniref:Glycerol uptake operon antiterminator regulatory protein n=1 Tax=Paenibacillus cellulosilyticus TaxID=375489 RepID=A0A2V2YMB5_9BACL|nr:glycerol-3-phosphate responsive antiterminator [Paenibacillus cellulosilyticus]PWV95530.1 glycerol uptake operon antiterminator [Paenibacillus cellulosilyticus]QKS47389.1 glycerol-3-phosphate responsive antiterminator [Paenibacillus cellulosilyticus]
MKSYPIIASVTKEEQFAHVLESDVERVNLMTGHIGNLESYITKLHDWGKQVYVHIEMIAGLGRDAHTVAYLRDKFQADGIITTKSNIITAAKQSNLRTIQRIFAIDTAAIHTAVRMINNTNPDEVELMPGLMPRVTQEVKGMIKQPLIVGGLIRHEEEIVAALASGADFISSGDPFMWRHAMTSKTRVQ